MSINIALVKRIIYCLAAILFLGGVGKSFAQKLITISITNNSQTNIHDYILQLPVESLSLQLGKYKLTENESEISPIELITDIWGNQQALLILPAIAGNESKSLQIQQGDIQHYPKRTAAELTHKIGGQFMGKEYIGGYSWVKTNSITLPGTFTDHSYYFKYEGPGWESDKVAYRFYLDNRNAIDVFAKNTSELVLSGVGMDGFDNYHNLAAWGMDNLKVGKSLGLGSIATWDGEKAVRIEKKDSTTCIIAADGKLRSQVKTIYHGWQAGSVKCNLTSLISIDAGSRASHVELLVDKPIDNIATGFILPSSGKLTVYNNEDEEWSYIATFGKQSLNKDMQGLVVFARTKQIKGITKDELNHILILQPDDRGYVDYYIMPTWELDKEPVKTKEEFTQCIEEQLSKLNNNIQHRIIKE